MDNRNDNTNKNENNRPNNQQKNYNDRSREENRNHASKERVPDCLSYNTWGAEQTSATFTLTAITIRDRIAGMIRERISGLHSVTWDFIPGSDAPEWYAWFYADSDHFFSKMEETMIGNRIPTLSDEFRKFANSFGYYPKDDGAGDSKKVNINKIFVANDARTESKIRGVRLSITSFLSHGMDITGKAFASQYKVNAPKMYASLQWIFEEDRNGRAIEVIGVEISKTVAGGGDRAKPRVARNGKF